MAFERCKGLETGVTGKKMFVSKARKKGRVMYHVTGSRSPAHASGQAHGLLGNLCAETRLSSFCFCFRFYIQSLILCLTHKSQGIC